MRQNVIGYMQNVRQEFKSICSDASFFKSGSGTHGLNEELGRHRGREECTLCGAEYESVVHVL